MLVYFRRVLQARDGSSERESAKLMSRRDSYIAIQNMAWGDSVKVYYLRCEIATPNIVR
jgi:hypothetical protein